VSEREFVFLGTSRDVRTYAVSLDGTLHPDDTAQVVSGNPSVAVVERVEPGRHRVRFVGSGEAVVVVRRERIQRDRPAVGTVGETYEQSLVSCEGRIYEVIDPATPPDPESGVFVRWA